MNKIRNYKKWIAVYTKANHEKTVEHELKKRGFEVYLPLLKTKRVWSDRKKWVEHPLFRSYLFVRVEINNTLFLIKTPNIVKIVKFGNEIAIIQDSTIKSIKIMLQGNYNPKVVNYFLRGDLVKINDGPLKGLTGEVIKENNKDRLLIKVDVIQYSLSIEIDKGYLVSK